MIADGVPLNGHFLMGLASNVHLYAGGIAQLSPQARLDDGVLDLWLFEGDTLGDAVQCAWDMFAGRHAETGRVRQISFRSLEIETEGEMYLQVDGEPVHYDQKSVKLSVQRQALKVLIPDHTPWQLFLEGSKL
jgi:diacylglycerol kinase family enzyme